MGVTNVVDPLGGSWYIEEITNRMEREVIKYFDQIDELLFYLLLALQIIPICISFF